MRYLGALPVIALLVVVDLVAILTIIGLWLLIDDGPFSYRFARLVWVA